MPRIELTCEPFWGARPPPRKKRECSDADLCAALAEARPRSAKRAAEKALLLEPADDSVGTFCL